MQEQDEQVNLKERELTLPASHLEQQEVLGLAQQPHERGVKVERQQRQLSSRRLMEAQQRLVELLIARGRNLWGAIWRSPRQQCVLCGPRACSCCPGHQRSHCYTLSPERMSSAWGLQPPPCPRRPPHLFAPVAHDDLLVLLHRLHEGRILARDALSLSALQHRAAHPLDLGPWLLHTLRKATHPGNRACEGGRRTHDVTPTPAD